MNRIILLEQLRDFTKAATGDIILPVKEQKGDAGKASRAADIHLMRLPTVERRRKKRHTSSTN